MPQSQDPTVVQTGTKLVETLKGAFHTPAGYRPVHAKGLLLTGTFTPTPLASRLSIAPHFNNPSTPIIGRFSNNTGIPKIPDTDDNANPAGFALRFVYGDRKHTDIISHAVPLFPVKTGQEMLEFLGSLGDGTIGQFLATHEKTKKFVEYPKPHPERFDTQRYYALNAFKLVDGDGKVTVVRYQIHPFLGEELFLQNEQVKSKSENYLFDQFKDTITGGETVKFRLMVQVGQDGDPTNDITNQWPDDRKIKDLGVIEFNGLSQHDEEEQKNIIFDPIPRVKGVEPSDDPLLEMRASVYLTSGKERRAAPHVEKEKANGVDGLDGQADGAAEIH
ncbi:hypothetical protein V865_008515 [Kwoniella europaea PYCC6329]|uniref:Catalase core domain-containing protein n=1 Tax=Kwoniella europaea PYCC6329 TaxID=1423913 RepID=A0AAX4KXM9_9TREE